MVVSGPLFAPGSCGLAEVDPAELGNAVLAAWAAFLTVVEAPTTDLTRPSRLPGWTGRDMLVHLGSWPGAAVMDALVTSASQGGTGPTPDPEAVNDELDAEHASATPEQVVQALHDARDRIAAFFAGDEPAQLGQALSRSTVGPLPLLSLVHAGCFELAVHALDLAPCGAPEPASVLLERGLAALLDVTGALAARAGVELTLTAQTPAGGWGSPAAPRAGPPSGTRPARCPVSACAARRPTCSKRPRAAATCRSCC